MFFGFCYPQLYDLKTHLSGQELGEVGQQEDNRQGLQEAALCRQAECPVEPDEEQLSLLVYFLSDYLGTTHF